IAAPAGAPVAFVARATEPPNDRMEFGELETDGIADATFGKINGTVNVSGSEPFVDVWDDGSYHVYWLRPLPGTIELGSTSRAGHIVTPVGVDRPPPGASLGPRITVVPNPASGFVTFSWDGEAASRSRIAVYSVAGRLVARSAADVRAMRWDGRDGTGAR